MKIDKGIPMPDLHNKKGNSKYPWKDMEIGDSFFVPGKRANQFSVAVEAGRRLGRTFRARTVDGGVRVWRTS